VGAGIWPDVDTACQTTVKSTGSTSPQSGMVAEYEQSYAFYRQLYPALKPISHGLSSR
jgi:xylulokinase